MENETPNLVRDYLSKDAAAAALGIHPFTLKRWRMRGYGPQCVKVGGRLRYRQSDIQAWLESLGREQQGASQ
ncbi:helix-turn-helix domain-containing protein [Luteimonas sp. 50]|uniref:Helix-turn-helix domain-containing protein n=1 Tax=Cognatiluteimonas sedimenti TaxID=2927791 RepID=A0ABT0A1Y0_9GAMM|nr:helix-turn-helix domain-containing protein [Lysobacter sedimenti]MCJ0824981.1 helix-turn-helix domain-containing protein [Lysobacter sedimenti]